MTLPVLEDVVAEGTEVTETFADKLNNNVGLTIFIVACAIVGLCILGYLVKGYFKKGRK